MKLSITVDLVLVVLKLLSSLFSSGMLFSAVSKPSRSRGEAILRGVKSVVPEVSNACKWLVISARDTRHVPDADALPHRNH